MSEYADPFLVCESCGRQTTGRDGNYNAPCGHRAGFKSICPSWSPVEGCLCQKYLGYVPHVSGEAHGE